MPMTDAFRKKLFPRLPELIREFGTPFHIYDMAGIRKTADRMVEAFGGIDYRNYFAVKALPDPTILSHLGPDACFDCSSVPELVLARQYANATGEHIMFTSNNTSAAEFREARLDGGCILNLDDISFINRIPKGKFPELICFRYNPGKRRTGNSIIGNPYDAKYGITHEQVIPAYRAAMRRGATRFGLHTMVCSNELRIGYMIETVRMLLSLAALLKKELGIELEFINMGGGWGIPYRPSQHEINLRLMARRIVSLMHQFRDKHGFMPALFSECGRYITGPNGVLVSQVINEKNTYHRYIGVDTGMPALMRPAMYDAYHHIDILTPNGNPRRGRRQRIHVVGSICENCDRLTQKAGRLLPRSACIKDIAVIHDTGAHAIAMGFQYNGRLRPQTLAYWADDTVTVTRTADTIHDYLEPYVRAIAPR